MSLLTKILRAAHCRSTHHFFAIDALDHVQTDKGRALAKVLLSHHAGYLLGAKDPDTRFRDFQNHVLHVSDDHWGGAPGKAAQWSADALECLNEECWEDAAYSIGVLTHYFTDPLMPLHTASSDAESVVHRPMEWSVCKTYEDIYARWQASATPATFSLPKGANWTRQAVKHGAELSHPHYTRLIEIYDLPRGVKSPPEGLNDESRDMLAELFGYAVTGIAAIIDRLAGECKTAIPNSSVALATVIAGIEIPVAWVVKKIHSAKEKHAVRALFAEYQTTGTVKRNLPPEIKTVREFRAAASPVSALAKTAAPITPVASAKTPDSIQMRRVPSQSTSDDLVDAPSIGPKTAKRFAAIGIHTIGEFLSADPEVMANQLATSWIDSEKLIDWQHQARLVTRLSSLCGYKAQLLVAVGCTSVEALAQQNAESLSATLTDCAETSAGKRILRSSSVPSQDDIQGWIDEAADLAARKAA